MGAVEATRPPVGALSPGLGLCGLVGGGILLRLGSPDAEVLLRGARAAVGWRGPSQPLEKASLDIEG